MTREACEASVGGDSGAKIVMASVSVCLSRLNAGQEKGKRRRCEEVCEREDGCRRRQSDWESSCCFLIGFPADNTSVENRKIANAVRVCAGVSVASSSVSLKAVCHGRRGFTQSLKGRDGRNSCPLECVHTALSRDRVHVHPCTQAGWGGSDGGFLCCDAEQRRDE